MDTQTNKDESQQFSQSYILTQQAKEELSKYGYVLTKCPKCHSKITITAIANRVMSGCDCGYVSDIEIYG